jgi:hypothetical protein
MEKINETITNTTTEAKKRPRLLRALCIFTWMRLGIQLIISGYIFYTSHAMSKNGVESLDITISTFLNLKNAQLMLIVSVIGALLCLLGSIQMWKLKKAGFYIYVIGELGTLIVLLILSAHNDVYSPGWESIFPIAFIVLYSSNLKYLK